MRSTQSSLGNIAKTTVGVVGAYMVYDWMKTVETLAPSQKEDEDSDDDVMDPNHSPDRMCCPISNQKMTDPVYIKGCEHTFERKNIEAKFDVGRADDPFRECPICGEKFSKLDLCYNQAVKEVLELDTRGA